MKMTLRQNLPTKIREKKIIYDTNEVKASIAPVVAVLVGFIAKQGLKKAIQKYGKTVVTSMIRTSPQVAAQAAKKLGYSATKHVSHGKKCSRKIVKGVLNLYLSIKMDTEEEHGKVQAVLRI